MRKKPTKLDRRLLGTWRSDRRKTMSEWVWPRTMKLDRRKWFAGLFGHLHVHYMPQSFVWTLKEHRERVPYEVLASDEHSVAILSGGQIRQINFEGNHYWISLGRNREWFKRIKPPRRQAAARRS